MAAGVGGARSPLGSVSGREGLSPGPQCDAAVFPGTNHSPSLGLFLILYQMRGVNVRVSKALSAQYPLTLTFFG